MIEFFLSSDDIIPDDTFSMFDSEFEVCKKTFISIRLFHFLCLLRKKIKMLT